MTKVTFIHLYNGMKWSNWRYSIGLFASLGQGSRSKMAPHCIRRGCLQGTVCESACLLLGCDPSDTPRPPWIHDVPGCAWDANVLVAVQGAARRTDVAVPLMPAELMCTSWKTPDSEKLVHCSAGSQGIPGTARLSEYMTVLLNLHIFRKTHRCILKGYSHWSV